MQTQAHPRNTAGRSVARNCGIAWKYDDGASHESRTLYRTTWENPRPDEQVVMVDFESTVSGSSLILLAVTTEP